MIEVKRLPLSLAARELQVSGEVARRLTLKGVLDGELQEGRWFVSQSSVDAAKSARRAGQSDNAA